MTWNLYIGPGFERYEIWRRAFGQDPELLQSLVEVETSAWTDTTARPGANYSYWTKTIIFGADYENARSEIFYEIPAVSIQSLSLSSATASAELGWSEYDGPTFETYEVRRRIEGDLDVLVARLRSHGTTSFTDTLLDGNDDLDHDCCSNAIRNPGLVSRV